MPTKHPRFSIAIPDKMYNEVEEYRYNAKYKSQNSAVIALIALGLQSILDESPKKEAPAPMERELTLKQQQIVGLLPFIPEKIQDAILAICDATADRSAAAGFGFYHDPDYIQSARDNTDPADNSEEHSG